MDSLSLSGCGKVMVFVAQDEPGTVKRWGRYVVSMDGIDDLQKLAQKELSASRAIPAKPDLPSARSRQLVSGEKVSGNDNLQQFDDALKPFGFHHPFYSTVEMRVYASGFLRNFSEAAKATTSNSRKCNILFSLYLAHQFSCEIISDRDLIQEVVNIDTAFFTQYVRCVELYRQMSEQQISTLRAEQVQELYELVQETEFFPAAWLLVKLALNNDNRYLFSPFFLSSLMSPFLHRSGEVGILVRVFSAQEEDALIYFNDLEQLKGLNGTISPADVFMVHIASTVSGEPVTNNQWLREQSNISESIQMNVFTKWSDIVASRRAGGRGYIRDLNIHCPYEQVHKVMAGRGGKFVGKRQFNSMRGELFKQHDKDAIRRTFFVQILQNPAVQDSPFLVTLIRLTQSLMYQCSAGVSRRPMTSLMYLVHAADTGVFPLLHKNAGDIYFGFGLFEKARVQYQLLYSHCGLPESLKKRLESLIEMCDLNIPAPFEAADPAPETAKKTGKVRHRQRKKTTNAPKSVECASSAAAETQSHPPYQEPGKSLPADAPQDPLMDGKVAEQPDVNPHPGHAEADPVPAGFTTVSYSRVKKAGEFRPKPGSFSDQNQQVREFNRQVNCFRDVGDLVGEKECIERWLRDEQIYGRICEDAAWFYLRQCILPIQMKRAVLDCDLQTMEKDQVIGEERMLGFALNWIARAMACYLESPLDRRVRSSRLREILVSFHEHYPEKKRDAEACKRLRSGCSGFGHVFSQWSAVVSNSKMKGLHMQRGHEFFALKRVADPLYYQLSPGAGLFVDGKVVTTSDVTG